MTVLVALDSFKGSLSSREASEALAKGIRSERPDEKVIVLPVADGGDGLIDCLKDDLLADGWQIKTVLVSGPYGQNVEVPYLAKGDCAVIEMATCCGLTLVPKEQRRVIFASSYGLGEVIRDAYLNGARQIHIGLGGSATNDLGLGCMQALGVKFFDADGKPITDHISANDFSKIARLDTNDFSDRFKDISVWAVCDVNNPLLGPTGATAVFGPQKGVQGDDLSRMQSGMAWAATILSEHFLKDFSQSISSGAAGGMGAALMWFFNAKRLKGIDAVLDMIGFDAILKQSDYVLTGEGSFDDQSLSGKAPSGVLERTNRINKPTFLVAGSLKITIDRCKELGFANAYDLLSRSSGLTDSLQKAEELLTQIGRQWAKTYL